MTNWTSAPPTVEYLGDAGAGVVALGIDNEDLAGRPRAADQDILGPVDERQVVPGDVGV